MESTFYISQLKTQATHDSASSLANGGWLYTQLRRHDLCGQSVDCRSPKCFPAGFLKLDPNQPLKQDGVVEASMANSMEVEMRAWYQSKFRRDDKDGNGLLTPDEAPTDFAAIDLDKDGLISLDEYIARRAKR